MPPIFLSSIDHLVVHPSAYSLFGCRTFLELAIEKLDDHQIKSIATLACVLTAWGFISYVLTWAFRSTEHETLVLIVGILQKFIPTVVIPGSAYFMYFCLGYFFRRLAPQTSDSTRKKLIALGFIAWAVDVICAYSGVNRFDPSFPWLFASIVPASPCCSSSIEFEFRTPWLSESLNGPAAAHTQFICCNTPQSLSLPRLCMTQSLQAALEALSLPSGC